MLTDLIFNNQPAMTKFPSNAQFKPGHGVASVKTYRYLRLGMLLAVVALGWAMVEERNQPRVHCFLGSISTYYYTPVHPVFIGVLVALGVALIVIKGRTAIEDAFLTIAGVLAPIVAFVPTSNDPNTSCAKKMAGVGRYQTSGDAHLANASISNDLHAYLFAGTLAVILFLGIALVQRFYRTAKVPNAADECTRGTWWSLIGAAGLVLVGWLFLTLGFSWVLKGHGIAAAGMIAFLAFAALANGFMSQHTTPRYARSYLAVGGAMIGSGLIFLVIYKGIDQNALGGELVLAIEAVEIALFGAFWALQTVERWNQTV